jgi:hypothetical protein
MLVSLLDLPDSSASMPLAICHLEAISVAIHDRFAAGADSRTPPSLEAYARFRTSAYRLLTHYVDQGLDEAFRWLLVINDAAPERTRITLEENPFHWGLMAMTAAAGTFMSPNKLRDLGASMKRAHAEDVLKDDFEVFIRGLRRRQRHRAIAPILAEFRQHEAQLEAEQNPPPRPRRRTRSRSARRR